MIYALAGAVLGVLLAAAAGWPADSGPVVAVVGAGVAYLASCAVWPYATCWWCRDRRRREDGHGNYRDRRCQVCGDDRYVRVGARLMWWWGQ